MFGALPHNAVFYPSSSMGQLLVPSSTSTIPTVTFVPTVTSAFNMPSLSVPPPPTYAEALVQQHNALMSTLSMAMSPDITELNLRDGEEDVTEEQPLDLSLKKPSIALYEPSTSSRTSVIRGNGLSSGRSCEVKRSASSVSYKAAPPEPDVSEHFRRSLSGKWPRRQNYAHYTPPNFSSANSPSTSASLANLRLSSTPIPEDAGDGDGSVSPDPPCAQLRRKISTASTASTAGEGLMSANVRRTTSVNPIRVTQIIINQGQVEDHFRKALGEEKFRRHQAAQKATRTGE